MKRKEAMVRRRRLRQPWANEPLKMMRLMMLTPKSKRSIRMTRQQKGKN